MSDIFRALVVDDEELARRVISAALVKENFSCDFAADGNEAMARIRQSSYDLLVTDLKMPNKHGHALAMEVKQLPNPPFIVVHSVVDDPRIIKDLILRGVDDIIPKPADYASFAAKIRALILRRSREAIASTLSSGSPEAMPSKRTTETTLGPEPDRISIAEIESKIPLITRIMPLSSTAMDVLTLTREGCDARKLSDKIQNDPSLTAEVLAIANSSFYNPTQQAISDVDQAVVRIGQRRIGELSMATSLLTTVTARTIPWMSMKTVWRQSMAAGIATEHLIRQGKHEAIRSDLVLIAIMNSLGHIILATLYPTQYERMVYDCDESGRSLLEQASRVFPETHAATMSRLQESWGFPSAVYAPMRHIADPYNTIEDLPEPMRTRIELLKVAVFIGKFIANEWHPWDHIDVPSESVLTRLRITDISEVISQTHEDAKVIGKLSEKAAKRPVDQMASGPDNYSPEAFHYKNVSTLPIDVIAPLVEGMGLKTTRATSAPTSKASNVVINALGLNSERTAIVAETTPAKNVLVLTESMPTAKKIPNCTFLTFPTSYGRMNRMLHGMVTSRHRISDN